LTPILKLENNSLEKIGLKKQKIIIIFVIPSILRLASSSRCSLRCFPSDISRRRFSSIFLKFYFVIYVL